MAPTQTIQVVGLSHVTAPVRVRERVAVSRDALPPLYRSFRHGSGLVVLSTCNRTEFYAAGGVTLSDLLALWEEASGVPREEFSPYLYWHRDDEAVLHLFRVAATLESMIVGEAEILGQVRAAYQEAAAAGAAGALHRVFQAALKAGKRAKTETGIGRNALSVGHVVVELAERVFGALRPLDVMVIGAGETARLVARHLREAGVGEIVIANRGRTAAESLARSVGGRALALEDLASGLRAADLVVAATGGSKTLVTRSLAETAYAGQSRRVRFLFDLSVPRAIAPDVARSAREIFVYDIDDVREVVEKNRRERMKEADRVERIIAEEMRRLQQDLGAGDAGDVIRSLREKAETIRRGELERAWAKLPGLDDHERHQVELATERMINKLLNDPMVRLRQGQYLEAVAELFRLDGRETGSTGAPAQAAERTAHSSG